MRTAVLVLGIFSLVLCGCKKDPVTGPDGNKDDLVAAYEAQCRKMNTNIKSLQTAVEAVGNKDYVIGAESFVKVKSSAPADDKRYNIVFAAADLITIYTDVAPLVAIEMEDDAYWWTLNGEFILDDQDKKMAVDAVAPQLKIKDAKWQLSCDSGRNWTEIEPAEDASFMSVTQDEENVYVAFNGQTLTLTKTPPAPEVPDFVFTFNEISASSVKFDVAVADDNMRYTIMSVDKAYASMFDTDEELFEDDLSYFNSLLEYGYASLAEVITDYTAVGDQTDLVMSGLDPETEYLFYAYGLELDGTRTTDIHREYITTKAVEKVDVTFEIEAVVDGVSIDVAITPSGNDFYYYFDAIEKESVDIDFGGDIAEAAKYYIDYNVEMGAYYGMTAEEVILEIASLGPDQYMFSGMPGTEYVIFAMAVGLDGNITSDVVTKSVVTGEIAPSDNVITLNVDEVTKTTVTVSTTTTNEDPYFLGIEPAYMFEGMTDDQIIEEIVYMYGDYMNYATEYGNVEKLELTYLEPGTEYLLMAFGHQSGVPTTALVKQVVTTEAGSNPAECTFDVTFDSITENSAVITVTPSLDDVRYYWDLGMSAISDEDLIAAFDEEIQTWIEYGEVSSVIEFWQAMSYTGVDSWEYTELEPGTEYEVFITPIDMTTGSMITPFIRVPFTTLGAAPAAVKSAPIKVRKAEKPSRPAAAITRRAEVKQPVQEELTPMRRIDLQNATKVHVTKRHSAFIQK